ncbi:MULTISPECIES: glycosyltransferase family 1 protein [unclassified Oceanobacter]|jgi:glycosyltransferase involved in cell wall biosynthesis|uniref:glycosyltransferase family 4 protein n=1 Tax=unclassified Oceanobacter TaxID=2620260 RepID=UPI002733DB76|nr:MULTISPECIES: glycosyltransferase family 1 protein [unclassified Oceanobacter]MDP2506571.1 glycosyltransferase family 1 protein [Oceanobacter sp. 3_MG-2023]MDP2548982.1 glycosyltransferase family 1 protein [Oceanobacter sp. 4_MG-2023]MDP2609635.1 glycosyltransferase family 1 protein [Oceanobacter sp. 1_MG-2023]MDP2613353.1 glycosyltransferase family 1 protein [Oceanobacter sp. 2_MG-2023]
MAPLRISIVTETYVPDVNGVANSLRQLINALDPRHFQVQLIRTRPRSTWRPEVEEVWCRGLTIPMYPDLQIGWPARGDIRAAWDRFQPEFVFIATEGPLGNSALNLATERGIPVLSAFHTNFHRYSSYYGLGWIRTLTLNWLRRFHNRTAGTLVPSEEVAGFLCESSFHNVQVLPHGVNCHLFHPRRRSISLRQSWQVKDSDRVMLYVGRIAAEKNIPLAIAAYDQLRVTRPDLKLVMVGDGPMRGDIQASHPDVIFAGVQTGEALARHFASADLFVFPSVTETFGLVTLEAMASGLPVAAFDMAAAHMHIQSGVNGSLAPVEEKPDIAERMFVSAAEALLESDLVEQGKAARVTAEQLSWECVAGQFSRYIDRELDQPIVQIGTKYKTMV